MRKHLPQIILILFISVSLVSIWAFQYVPAGEFAGFLKAQLVGQKAEIQENPFNKLAQQFEEKEQQLKEKEVELNRREEFLIQEIQEEQQRRNMIVLAIVIITVLVVLINFFLDFRREKREEGILRSISRKLNS